MALTASYIAACMIAKLRVGWMVAGCAPGVRTITRSVRFHLHNLAHRLRRLGHCGRKVGGGQRGNSRTGKE